MCGDNSPKIVKTKYVVFSAIVQQYFKILFLKSLLLLLFNRDLRLPKSSFWYLMEAFALNNLLCYYRDNYVFTKVRGRQKGQEQSFADVFKKLRNFTGKHLCWSIFLIKLFSYEILHIFKNTFFYRTLPVAGSGKGLWRK